MNNYLRLGRTKPSKNQTPFKNFLAPAPFTLFRCGTRRRRILKKRIYNFCEGEDAKCLAHFAAPQNVPNTKKPKRTTLAQPRSEPRTNHFVQVRDRRPSERRAQPPPPGGASGGYTTSEARPSGRYIRSLNLKERIKSIVKPKHKAIRKS